MDHFGFLAPFYDRLIRPADMERYIQLVGLPVAGAMLDAGGGTGRISQALTGCASSVVVTDLSMGMLYQASEKKGLIAMCAATEHLPFHDAYFERVIMVDALHHVIDQVRTIHELWRVLKPGGRILIEEPDIRTAPVKIIAIAEKLALMRSQFLSPPDIALLFNYKGARVMIEQNNYNAWVMVDKT